jgi:TonB-linked SusC/RagA family outer membrane protein
MKRCLSKQEQLFNPLLRHGKLLKRTFNLFLLTSLLLVSASLQAQQKRITGRVLSGANNQPLVGASVTVKGSNLGTTTDPSGNFALSVDDNAVLVIGFVGYAEQEIPVANQTSFNVTLSNSTATMNDVVVIGYQTVRKRDLTGATSVVNTQNTARIASRSLPEQLQGMAAGVSVRTGGAPGQEAVVNIRGLSTVNGNGNPLYVIDGMFSDPNTTVNPNDIESIQVLKDASAAAIYGSRAGNGVIIITTKKGREGPLKVGATAKYGFTQVPKTYDMMNGAEYVATAKTAYQNSGFAVPAGIANYNGQVNTNWADEILRTGGLQDYNLSLSGGSRNANVFISGSYLKDEGTLTGHSFERAALRINSQVSKGRFKISENLMLSNSTRRAPVEGNFQVGNPWQDMFNNLPIIPVRGTSYVTASNPGGYGMGTDDIPTFSHNYFAVNDLWNLRSNFFKVLGNVYVDFKILNSLSYRFNLAGETSLDHTNVLRKTGIYSWRANLAQSSVEENRGQFLNTMLEHTLNYNTTLGDHTISAVAGLSNQTIKDDYSGASRAELAVFGGQYFTTINSATGALGATGTSGKTYINSYFGRVNYSFKERYLASFTIRSDKSSLFSPKYRRGYFPSGAVSWRISNEEFFKKGVVSDLKLRGSYGILGLAGLGRYQYTGFLNQGTRAVFGVNQTEVTGGTQARLVPGDLKWERKATANIGLDAGFMDNTFTATIDVFRSKTNDVLIEQPLPGYLGNLGGNPIVNIGTIENKGIELELGYRPRLTGDFRWNVSANFSFIRNKILELGNLGIDPVTGKARNYIQSGNTRSQVGRSIGEYFVLKTDGIFQSQKEIDDHKAQSAYAKPGDIRYLNLVNGGSNDDINDQDRDFAGSPWPKFSTGLQGNLSYKDFSLNIQLYGAFGQKLYNDVRRNLDAMDYSNYRTGLDYWTPTNPSTSTPRLGISYTPVNAVADRGIQSNVRGNTDRWIENGSYLRLRNLELAYTFPKALLTRLHLGDSRIFVGGQNLFTITKYTGLDPDVTGANANLEPGVDLGTYPASRIVTVGFNIGF